MRVNKIFKLMGVFFCTFVLFTIFQVKPASAATVNNSAPVPEEFTVTNRRTNLGMHMTSSNSIGGFDDPGNPSNQWTFVPVDGNYVIRNVRTGLELHVTSNNSLATWNDPGNTSNQWKLINVGDDYYNIVNVRTGLQLHMNAQNGVVLWNDAGNTSNQWKLQKSEPRSYNLVNKKYNNEPKMDSTNHVVPTKDSSSNDAQWKFVNYGNYYIIINTKTNLQLHLREDYATVGWNDTGNPSNQWVVTNLWNGYYSIQNVRTGYYLCTNGNEIGVTSAKGEDHTQWRLQIPPDGQPSQDTNLLTRLVSVAKAEIGYQAGAGKWTKYGSWYGIPSADWCAMFVSWCANQSGISTGIIPKHASCQEGANWFKNRAQWKSRTSGYVPKAGDIIYFDYGSNGWMDHVGIVESVSNGIVYTIEGNIGGGNGVVGRVGRSLSHADIAGYGIPQL